MDLKDHAPALPFIRSESLQHQNPYAHYRLKYESTYHPFLKKTKIFNSKVSRWFKLTEKGFLYSCTNKENHAQKIIPTNSFDISEARPLVKGSNFCVKLQRKKGSPYWIQCDTNEEKQFLLNYFAGRKPIIQANPSDISINNIISTREQPGIISEETSELPGQYFDELDPMLMNEEIAAELFKSEQPSVEKRVQMYQKTFVKIGMEGIQDKGARLKSFLADSSFDIVETEAGIGNNIPKLPCLKRVGAYYYRGISAPIYHADFEPLPKIMDEDSFDENGLFETFLRSEKKETVKERDLRLKTSKSVAEVDNVDVDDYDDDELSDDGIGISHSVRQVQVKDLLLNPTSLLMQNRDSDGFLKAVRNMSNTARKQTRQGARSRSSLNNSCSQISQKNDKETCSTKDIKIGENKDHGATSLPSIKVEKMLFEQQEKLPDKDYNVHVREFDKSQIKSVEDCINAGHRLLWQYELGKARECFGMYRGESTLVELMDCECELHEVLVTGREQKVKQMLNRLLVILARINKEAANIKEDSDKYIEVELNRTEASLLKCVAYCFQSNKFQVVKAIADTWRGYRKIENLIKKRSVNHTVSSMDLHRYKFGHGVFALTFSSFSPALLKLIKLIGIKSDRAEGFKLLEECRKEKNIRSHYASLIVTLFKSEVLGALDDASDLIAKSLRDSHGSSLFYWVGSLVSWKYTRMHDSNLMLKAALACLGDDCSKAVYFKYELGLHYFLNGEWETALAIFTEIGSQTFSRTFIANHINEAQTLAKSMKVGIPVDFSQWEKDINDVPDEERSIMPCPVQVAIKIACCYFNMDKRDLGMKWLFCIILLYKKYSGIQTKGEEEFYHLTLKYIGKDTVKMLTYETYYFTKYLPKVPDENLENIIEDLNDYQQMLSGSFDMSKSNPALPDYISSILVNVVCNCLLGETELACEMYNSVKPLFNKLPEQYTYLVHHIEYWIGRALAEDGKVAEAKEMLKSSLKKKKCVLNIGSKVKQVLVELESQG